MKFEALMRLYPPGYFGLPDGDAKIIPGTLGRQFNIESDPIDSSTLEKVGHGTMPVYRRPEEALNLNLKSGDVEVALKDNYLTLNFEAEGYDDATLKARAFALGLLRRLHVTMGVLFHYRRVKLTGEDGRVVPSLPKAHFNATVYSLSQLKQAVVDAVEL